MSTVLAGVGGIIKQGSGTLTLTGNNNLIGPTANITVVGGTHSISIPLSASGVPQPPPANAAAKSSPQLLAQNENAAQSYASTDQPIARPPSVVKFPPAIFTADNAFSTFALNVSDASYQLARAALQNRRWPDPAATRTEEFLNAFSYRDPAPGTGEAASFHYDLGQNPIESGGDLLRVSYQTAAGGRNQATPLRLTILLDGSGSMTRADRVATLRAAVRALGGLLRAGDTVSLVTFARTPQVRAVNVPAERFSEIVNIMDTLVPDGGTNMEEALKTAYAIARQSFDLHAQNRVILLTDGAANLGELDPAALAGIVEENRAAGIALDAYGVGWDGYDDSTLEALTRKSDGRYAFLNGPADVNAAFAQKLAGALTPAAQDVKLQIEFNPERVVSYRLMGYNNLRLTQAQFRDNSVSAGELAAAEQGTALYNLVLNPQGAGPIGTARARYRDPGTHNFHELTWTIPYNGRPPVFDQATPSLRLAAVAGYFAEYLQQSPFAGDASPRGLLELLRGVPDAFPNDPRPAGLVDALTTASALGGN
jgi:autotransporter-associated beta strand protein